MPPKKIVLKPWTDRHETDKKWLFNYIVRHKLLDHPEEDTFIDKNKRQIQSIIMDNEGWKDASKEKLLFTMARYLHNKGDNRYAKSIGLSAFLLMEKNKKKEDENELDEKEMISFRPHSYFVDILENTDFNQVNELDDHYKYLLLSMLTYQPPLRTNFYSTAKIIRSKADNDKVDNFVLINRRGKLKISYIVNKDKATNYKVYNMNKNLSSIDMDNESLMKHINDSYIKYPRTWLFEVKGKPVSQATLLSWLKNITHVEGITFNMMRASYITWFYQNNPTMTKRSKLAHDMRHSTEIASRNYNKVIDDDEVLIKQKRDELEADNVILLQRVRDMSNKLEAYVKDPDTMRSYKKRRSDIIYNLNKGRLPRTSTIKMYDIKLNPSTEKFE
jgi:hypothetical protein